MAVGFTILVRWDPRVETVLWILMDVWWILWNNESFVWIWKRSVIERKSIMLAVWFDCKILTLFFRTLNLACKIGHRKQIYAQNTWTIWREEIIHTLQYLIFSMLVHRDTNVFMKSSSKVLLQWKSTSVYTSWTYSTYHLELTLGTLCVIS